jgi:TRAP-type C4-dicarboxylate transport system permease small subunit
MLRLWRCCTQAAQALGGALFVALFGVFVLQVVSRFVFDRPLPWTDELAVVLYVWIILWACATMVPTREHVMFDLLWQEASPGTRRWMAALGHVLVGGLSLWALPACWDYVSFMSREATPVLDIPFSLVFLPFVLLLVALVGRSLLGLRQAWRGEGLDDPALPAVDPSAGGPP